MSSTSTPPPTNPTMEDFSPSPSPSSPSTNQTTNPDLYAASAAENALPAPSSDSAIPTPTPSKSSPPEMQIPNIDSDKTKEELVEEALNCPCIASMKEGSCGEPFIQAYKCFLESETEPKGTDCMDQFKSMQTCIADHPDEYNFNDDDDEDLNQKGNQTTHENFKNDTSNQTTTTTTQSTSTSAEPTKTQDTSSDSSKHQTSTSSLPSTATATAAASHSS